MAFLSWQYASAESIKRNMEILKNLQRGERPLRDREAIVEASSIRLIN